MRMSLLIGQSEEGAERDILFRPPLSQKTLLEEHSGLRCPSIIASATTEFQI